MKDSVYDFPVNMRAAGNTLREQVLVAMGEVAEAFAAIENGEGDMRRDDSFACGFWERRAS